MMRVTKKLYALLIAVIAETHRVNKAAKEVQILPPNLYHLTIFRIFQEI